MVIDLSAYPARPTVIAREKYHGSNNPVETLSSKMAALQLPDGSFASVELDLSTGRLTRLSDVFATALVAWLVSYSHIDPSRDTWLDNALNYLERQRDSSGLWAFRGRFGEFPPDLDDTSVALLALLRFHRIAPAEASLIPGSFGQNEAGLFGTWATSSGKCSNMVDLTANGHAVLALLEAGLRNEQLEAAFLKESEERWDALKSPYYCTSFPCRLARYWSLAHLSCSSFPLQEACSTLPADLNLLASEADLTNLSAGMMANKSPLYRRRRLPIVYTSEAVVLAYRFHLDSLR